MQKTLLLDAGSGGRASQRLISDLFARHFSNDILNVMDDAALLNIDGPVAMSTDTYTAFLPWRKHRHARRAWNRE